MNVFYEEDGAFKAGTVLSETGGAFQVESSSGKRAKVKAGHVLVQFKDPAPQSLLRDAAALADSIELNFLWECAPQEEFEFAALGADYFGHAPSSIESAALLMRLHSAPMYFYRKGRGRYKPAPADALRAALAGQERKRQQALQQAEYVAQLRAGKLPAGWQARVGELLFNPDKNGIEYKALEEAAREVSTTSARLMLGVGGLASVKELHRIRFVSQHFARGPGFGVASPPALPGDLPRANVPAFSIDDVTTTEIDDAFSVEGIPEGWRIGIHIAAPGLSLRPDDSVDVIARERLSTVYTPGEKFTMLPDSVIDVFSLAAGRQCPALSLYVDVRAADWQIMASHTRADIIEVAHNLRHNHLDALVTEESLDSGTGEYVCWRELGVLWQFAKSLYAARQAARVGYGLKPETPQRPDYNFYITGEAGDERVTISTRRRDAPLDKLVAELMVLANSSWGKLLADHEVAGIYRVQQGSGAAGKVRMTTHPAPHQGLGVAQYAWSSSPLRRYVDLVNQWQILSVIGAAPPAFAANDADLFAIVSSFEVAYAAYAEFQATMERYWCLRWLRQEGVSTTDALVLRDEWLRLADIPLQVRVASMPQLARGTRVEIEIGEIDEIDLSLSCKITAIIEEVDEPAPSEDGEVGEAELGVPLNP